MWSHARGLLSPSTIFGGGGGGGGGDKRDDRAKKARSKSKKKKREVAVAKINGLSSSSTKGGLEVASQVSHTLDDSDNGGGGETSKETRKIQNALNSSGSGDGGGGGSSSGYTSQLSCAPASLHHRASTATATTTTTDNMPHRIMQNGDRNNNNLTVGQSMYHASLGPRLPLVPMMIDDDDDDDDGEDCEGEEDNEQAIDLDLDDDDHDHDHEDLAEDHLSRLHHRHHDGSFQLIDGLRHQHEMRYTNGQRSHLRQPIDDKLSLANSIMFHDGISVAPHNHHHLQQQQHHHHNHFSLPPPTNTTTTSRGTTQLAYSSSSGGGGHHDDHGDCATAADSDATSTHHHQFQQQHNHHHHQYSNPNPQNHRLAYEAADLRPHLRGVGAKSNHSPSTHLTNHHHLQQQHQTIYYQPNLVNGDRSRQSNQVNNHHHHHNLLTSSNNGCHLRSGSFLQFQSAKSLSRQQQPPVPLGSEPTSTLVLHHQVGPNLIPSYNNNNHHHHHHALGLTNYPGKLGGSTTRTNNKNNKQNGSSTFRLATSSINPDHQSALQITNRMHHTTSNAPRHHHHPQQQQQHQSNHYLAAPDTSDSSHTSKQQVRRSRSNQQLSVSPTRQSAATTTTATRVHKSTSSNNVMAANGPAALVAASQMSANLSASAGRRQGDIEQAPPQLALGCCGKLAKFLLFIANILFWSAGIALGAWGILALVDDHKYNLSQLLVFDSNTRMSLFQLLSWSFITLGCATILVGVCGCSAMFKNSRWILGLYIFLILAIFALDLATGLLAMIFQERLVANVRLRLVNKLRNEYGLQASFTAAIDYIQTRYECCGLDGHFDYDQSLWRLQRLGGFEATVARTCCHLRNTFDDQAHVNPRPVNESMCQSTDVRFHQSYRYRRGCLDDLERLIRHKIWTFTIGCGIVGAIILLSLALATCFCRSIPSAERNGSNNNSANGSASRKGSANRVHQQALAYVENVSKKQGHHHHHQSSHYR